MFERKQQSWYDNICFEEALKQIRLPISTYRQLRGDLTETYKTLTNEYNPEICKNFLEQKKR